MSLSEILRDGEKDRQKIVKEEAGLFFSSTRIIIESGAIELLKQVEEAENGKLDLQYYFDNAVDVSHAIDNNRTSIQNPNYTFRITNPLGTKFYRPSVAVASVKFNERQRQYLVGTSPFNEKYEHFYVQDVLQVSADSQYSLKVEGIFAHPRAYEYSHRKSLEITDRDFRDKVDNALGEIYQSLKAQAKLRPYS